MEPTLDIAAEYCGGCGRVEAGGMRRGDGGVSAGAKGLEEGGKKAAEVGLHLLFRLVVEATTRRLILLLGVGREVRIGQRSVAWWIL